MLGVRQVAADEQAVEVAGPEVRALSLARHPPHALARELCYIKVRPITHPVFRLVSITDLKTVLYGAYRGI